MIRADVTGVTCLGSPRLLKTKLMAQVALLAFAYGAIGCWPADLMAGHAGELGNGRALHGKQRVAHFVRSEATFGNGFISRQLLGR